jgi:hypothetical protein
LPGNDLAERRNGELCACCGKKRRGGGENDGEGAKNHHTINFSDGGSAGLRFGAGALCRRRARNRPLGLAGRPEITV